MVVFFFVFVCMRVFEITEDPVRKCFCFRLGVTSFECSTWRGLSCAVLWCLSGEGRECFDARCLDT